MKLGLAGSMVIRAILSLLSQECSSSASWSGFVTAGPIGS
jgi:hypothetical protein